MVVVKEMLGKYRDLAWDSFKVKSELKGLMEDFFRGNESLKNHMVMVYIKDNGKYVLLEDYVSFDKDNPVKYEHIPLDILLEFGERFGLDLDSISVSVSWEYDVIAEELFALGRDNCFKILFEIVE